MPAADKLDTAPILITGAGRGIGTHMAGEFLRAGQPVVVHYRTATETVHALAQAGADLVLGDFDAACGAQAVAERVQDAAPRLRAIIHNASAFGPTAQQAAAAAEQFRTFFNVHMLAPFLLNRALADCLTGVDGAPADIIHISDIYADNPAVEYDSYCATKAGLQNLALSAAKRLAPRVKVNVIQPGAIDFQQWHTPTQQANVLQASLLQHAGGPATIMAAVRAILDNPFQTGAVIAVDGGRRLVR